MRVLGGGVVVLTLTITGVGAQCPQITAGATGTGCTALQTCADIAPFGLGDCKTVIPAGFYCSDFAAYGADCHACSCAAGCEADGGGGSPQDWRPGNTNPYGAGTSANGMVDLSATQQYNIVAQHNFVRAYHGACPLQWSAAIQQNVKDTAMASWSTCTLEHTPGTRASTSPGGFTSLGENLASQSSMYYANNFPTDLKTMSWYLEEYDWDYATSSSTGPPTGHFTQVVWKGTTHIGCVMWQCDYTYGKKVLLACQYGTAGNWAGQYAANVGARGEVATGCTACGDPPTAPPTASPTVSPSLPPVAGGTPTTSPAGPPTASPAAAGGAGCAQITAGASGTGCTALQ
eukprot:Hpha_TRINITY_DN15457_c0_g1::TRINITY_DN15457_c0_g1_i1::g.174399::m.174399